MKKRSLIIIFFTVFIDLVGFGIIIPLSPYLAREFGADALDVGLLMAIYSGMQFLFSPFWGRLSDRVGRRPIILISLIGASLSHLMFAYSSTLTFLFVARGLAGLFGANISTAMAYIADVTDEKSRSKGMGMIGAAFGLGFILGPALGAYFGYLGSQLGSQPPLGQSLAAIAAAVICFVNFLLALKVLPESLPMEHRDRLEKRPSRIKALTQFIHRPVIGKLMIMFLFSTLAMANMEASLFLLVKDDFSWSLVQAGMGFAYVGLIMVLTQGYIVRKMMPKWGERKVLYLGLSLAAIGFVGIGLSSNIPMLAVAVTFLGLGNGLTHPALNGSVSLLSKKNEQGLVMGVNQSLAAMGRVVGPAIGGYLYRDLGHEFPFLVAGSLNLVAMGVGATVFSRLPQAGRHHGEWSSSEPKMDKEISEIGGFQLFNIVQSDSPFLFLNLAQENVEVNSQVEKALSCSKKIEVENVMTVVSESAPDKSYPIILVCENGETSQRVSKTMTEAGYVNVYWVQGGLIQLNQFDPNA